ncbi:hypothetical protein BGZ76_001915 [Entomortierella beljakovae]|nr:hypothetical protein BGZ76_001915 [Entomortierella beljakovae]
MDPTDTTSSQSFGQLASYAIGWAYFIAWSASFYPQVILNYRRKSVQGLSLDFIYLNVLGFFCYSIFNVAFYYSTEVQEEYRNRNDGQDNLVRANDVFFAVHALVLSTFTLIQTIIYKSDKSQKVSKPIRLLIVITLLGAAIVFGAAIAGTSQWIDFLYYLSYIKLGISFLKYCPQVYLNYSAQSTVGWSIHNILLDFTGGALSITQLILDAYISGDWSGISGDPVKFGLGFLSILFDLVFMTQHYILYRNRVDIYAQLPMTENNNGERKALLLPTHRNYQSVQETRPASMKDLEMGAGSNSSQH